jgi:hypothetical protein
MRPVTQHATSQYLESPAYRRFCAPVGDRRAHELSLTYAVFAAQSEGTWVGLSLVCTGSEPVQN